MRVNRKPGVVYQLEVLVIRRQFCGDQQIEANKHLLVDKDLAIYSRLSLLILSIYAEELDAFAIPELDLQLLTL